MKKIILSTLLGLAVGMLPSCLKDDSQLFDASPAVRLDETIAKDKLILESASNGWIMQYYAGRNYSGAAYTLVLKFKDGKVSIMGDNKDPETVSTSQYDVTKDQGPVLTFPTYNSVIHDLAGASLGYPEGAQGDYEFAILEATPERIRLRGKKWKNEMILTPIPASLSPEEVMATVFTIREGMTSNTYDFILGKDTLAQGEVNVDSRHLTVDLEGKSYDIPYTLSATGLELQSPLSIKGKTYQSFAWNEEAKEFTSGDLSVRLFVPKSYKPIDFWVGEWTLHHDAIRGNRRPTILTLALSSRPNVLTGSLSVRGVVYPLEAIPYNPATGSIELVGQPLKDPTGRYAGGILLIPVSSADNNKTLETDHRITFVWDEEQERAIGEGSEMSDGKVDSFFGAAYGADLQPILDASGKPTFVFGLTNIDYMRKR